MEFLKFLVRIGQIFVIYKVVKLLYLTYVNNYQSNEMNELIWWICMLAFDLWLSKMLLSVENVNNKENEPT
jgi:hypothetical protein